MKNNEYWARRMQLLEEALLDKSYEHVEYMEKQYTLAIKGIEQEISGWYHRFAKDNSITLADARKLLTTKELEEFRWTVGEYIEYGRENAVSQVWLQQLKNASARVHVTRLDSLKLELQQQAEALYSKQLETLDKSLSEIYERGYYRTAFEIQKGVGIGWSLHGLTDSAIKKVLARPWTLDKKTFSDRVWENKESLVNTVSTQLTQMIMRGEAPDKTIRAITERFNVDKSKAGRLIMTESAAFANVARKDCFSDLDVERVVIVETLDSETCSICGALDGKIVPMSEYAVGVTVPPFHPWCRGTTAPYFEDLEGLGDRFARDEEGNAYKVPKDMNYQTWDAYNRAIAHEEQITDALQSVSGKVGFDLAGLDYRTKTPESYTRKVNTEAKEYLASHAKATHEEAYSYATSHMYDTVRYTALSKTKEFTSNFNKTVYEMKKAGYDICRVKNSLPNIDAPYRGVNTVFATPDGYKFELQFHTPESLDVKNKTHALYEEQRKDSTPIERKKELEKEMRKLTSSIKTPKDAETITPFDNLKSR